jgi:hypothetical protein
VAGLPDQEAKIATLSRFVQTNITYKAIEFGRRARIPNRPSEVLENRYGDCKDHAVVLQQLLVAVGVPADLALVCTHGPVLKDLPSLDQFNHMVVHVPGAGVGTFLDCTEKGSDLSQPLPFGLADCQALLLATEQAHLVTIPPYPEAASDIAVQQHIYFLSGGAARVDETMTLKGIHGAFLRGMLLSCPPNYRQMSLQREAGMDDLEITGFKIDGLDQPSLPLQLHFVYVLPNQFHRTGDRLLGKLRVGFERGYLTTGAVSHRSSPFETKIPLSFHSTTVIDAPEGFHPEPATDHAPASDLRFASFQRHSHADSRRLELNFECRFRAGKFGPAEYSAYREALAQTLSGLEAEVAFSNRGVGF